MMSGLIHLCNPSVFLSGPGQLFTKIECSGTGSLCTVWKRAKQRKDIENSIFKTRKTIREFIINDIFPTRNLWRYCVRPTDQWIVVALLVLLQCCHLHYRAHFISSLHFMFILFTKGNLPNQELVKLGTFIFTIYLLIFVKLQPK